MAEIVNRLKEKIRSGGGSTEGIHTIDEAVKALPEGSGGGGKVYEGYIISDGPIYVYDAVNDEVRIIETSATIMFVNDDDYSRILEKDIRPICFEPSGAVTGFAFANISGIQNLETPVECYPVPDGREVSGYNYKGEKFTVDKLIYVYPPGPGNGSSVFFVFTKNIFDNCVYHGGPID